MLFGFPSKSLELQFQDDSAMSHAAKMTKEEGVLDFREDAQTLHNKVGGPLSPPPPLLPLLLS